MLAVCLFDSSLRLSSSILNFSNFNEWRLDRILIIIAPTKPITAPLNVLRTVISWSGMFPPQTFLLENNVQERDMSNQSCMFLDFSPLDCIIQASYDRI